MKIIVLGGGDSPEREVSLRSAAAVAQAARQAGFDVEQIDPKNELDKLNNLNDVVVLPILHGVNGEDGVIQKELERRGLKFLGSDSQVSADCFDKWKTRELLTAAGIKMPLAEKVTQETYLQSSLSKKPHVLKVAHGGSSIGTLIVRNVPANQKEIEDVFALDKSAVLEELVVGIEITVPILGQNASPVIEIQPPQDKEFDYENKYNGASAELCPPQNVAQDLQEEAQRLAEQVHRVMGAKHLSRVDMMIDPPGQIYVLEINTMPGLTDQSLYPKSAAVAGLDMQSLVKKFIELANV